MKIAKVLGWALGGACVAIGAATADELPMQPTAYALPQDVVSAATAFADYLSSAARIDAGFSDGDAVARGLKTASSYETSQLEEGMIAYGAIAALQDDRFTAGVEQAAGKGDDRARFAEQLVVDPRAAMRIDGADEAARRVEAAIGDKAAALADAGGKVTLAAYTVQHQKWSQVTVADASARLADVKQFSRERAQPSNDDNQATVAAIGAGLGSSGADVGAQGHVTDVEARSLALAAEAVLGRAHSTDLDRLSPLFSEPEGAECLHMAKLNLYQCMAVAGPQYEDIYCMGKHALAETASCVAGAAHGTGATQIASLAGGTAYAAAGRSSPAAGAYVQLSARRSLRIDPSN